MTELPKLRPYGATYSRDHDPAGYQRPKSVTVDCHGHMFVAEADKLIRPHYPASELNAVKFASEQSRSVNIQQNKERNPLMESIESRLAEMDRMGIDIQIVSPVPSQFNYHAEIGLGSEACRIINETLSKSTRSNPRLIPLGTVPLQDCDRAIEELEFCINQLAMPGIEIGASVGKDELSTSKLKPFWARVEELEATILLHPTSFASERLTNHYLTNIIGNPLETTVAVAHLIMDGILEQFPKLKIILAHGGAYASQFAARMDHAWGARVDCQGRIPKRPSEYLSMFNFDTIVFAIDQLEYLYKKFGDERLLLGTDYAFDMGEYDPLELVLSTPSIEKRAIEQICGLNAIRLFNVNTEIVGKTDNCQLNPKL